MQITGNLAQRIVNVAMAVVHRNVNLMDGRGVIVGSGHPRRIGTLHAGALRAAQIGETVEIFPDDVNRYPGALEGINMPIPIGGRVVAVVGVYGDPPATRDTARLVRTIAEHILERERRYTEAGPQARLREEFFGYLTDHSGVEIPPEARQMAASLGFALEPRRAVLMASLGIATGTGPLPAEYRLPAIAASRLSEIESMLRSQSLLRKTDFVATSDRRLAVLLTADDADDVLARGDAVRRSLAQFLDLPVICGLGGIAAPEALPVSRRQAEFAAARCTPRRQIASIHETAILLDYLRGKGMGEEGRIAARPVLDRLDALCGAEPQLRATLAAVLAENLDRSAAALRLGVHRNTLSYRLDRIAAATGLRPCRSFDDAILVWLLLTRPPETPPPEPRTAGRSKVRP